jgi:hypothetical protein
MADHLLETLFVMCGVDGKIEASEQVVIDALRGTLPELRGKRAPERVTRAQLIDRLRTVDAMVDRRQIYVVALEVAYASGHMNIEELNYLALMQEALRIDDDFARNARHVIAAKYRR